MLAVNGEWGLPAKSKTIPDPLNGEPFIKLPDTQLNEIDPFVQSLRAVPNQHGLAPQPGTPQRTSRLLLAATKRNASGSFKKLTPCLPRQRTNVLGSDFSAGSV